MRDERPAAPRPLGVKRARDQLLARAALAGDEHGKRVAGQPADLVGDPAHRDRLARDPRQRLARSDRHVPPVGGEDDQRRVAERDDRPGTRPGLLDAGAADEGPVARADVFDGDAVPEHAEGAVPRAHRGVAHHDVGGGRGADDERVPTEGHPACPRLVLQLDLPGAGRLRASGSPGSFDDGVGSSTLGAMGPTCLSHSPLGRRRPGVAWKERGAVLSPPRCRASFAGRSTARSPRRRGAPSSSRRGARSPGSCGSAAMIFLAISRSAQRSKPARDAVISMACIQRLRSAFAPSSIHFWTTMRSDSRCTGCMCFTSSDRRRVDGLRHLARHGEVRHHDLDAGEEDHLQLVQRREEVLDVVLAAVAREVLADDERELLRREPGEHRLPGDAGRRHRRHRHERARHVVADVELGHRARRAPAPPTRRSSRRSPCSSPGPAGSGDRAPAAASAPRSWFVFATIAAGVSISKILPMKRFSSLWKRFFTHASLSRRLFTWIIPRGR